MTKIFVIQKMPTTAGVFVIEGRAYHSEDEARVYIESMNTLGKGAVIYGYTIVDLAPRRQAMLKN